MADSALRKAADRIARQGYVICGAPISLLGHLDPRGIDTGLADHHYKNRAVAQAGCSRHRWVNPSGQLDRMAKLNHTVEDCGEPFLRLVRCADVHSLLTKGWTRSRCQTPLSVRRLQHSIRSVGRLACLPVSRELSARRRTDNRFSYAAIRDTISVTAMRLVAIVNDNAARPPRARPRDRCPSCCT